MSRWDPCHFPDVRITGETAKAVKVVGLNPRVPDHAEWIPKSAVHDDSEVYQLGDEGRFTLKRWKAEDLGLVDDDEDPDDDDSGADAGGWGLP